MKVVYVRIIHHTGADNEVTTQVHNLRRALAPQGIHIQPTDVKIDEWPPKSEVEMADLLQLHQDRAKLQADFSDMCRHALEMSDDMVKHIGSKTKEEAIRKQAEDHVKKLNKLVQAHIKKYPD